MMAVKITPNDKGNPPGKLADAELHFTAGPLEGLKLIGFSIWEAKRGGKGGRNVTFPARQYTVNGDRRSFALLRPIVDTAACERLKGIMLEAYQAWETQASDYTAQRAASGGIGGNPNARAVADGCTCPAYPSVSTKDCPVHADAIAFAEGRQETEVAPIDKEKLVDEILANLKF